MKTQLVGVALQIGDLDAIAVEIGVVRRTAVIGNDAAAATVSRIFHVHVDILEFCAHNHTITAWPMRKKTEFVLRGIALLEEFFVFDYSSLHTISRPKKWKMIGVIFENWIFL